MNINRIVPALALLVLTSCGTIDLSKSCLPIQAPTVVTLVRETRAGEWGVDAQMRIDPPSPTRLDLVLPAGTTLSIDRISQDSVIDAPFQSIEVFGRLPDGRTFVYDWGFSRTIHRAPWEPDSIPQERSVPCAQV